MKLTEKKIQILDAIKDLDEPNQSQIADFIGKDRSTIYYHVGVLEENGYIEKLQRSQGTILRLKELGKDAVLDSDSNSDPTHSNTPTSNSNIEGVRLHNFKVVADLHDDIPRTARWFESWASHRELNWEEVDGGYTTYVQGFKVRFTSRKCIIYLGTFRGQDVEQVKDRAMGMSDKALNYFEDTPVKFDERGLVPKFKVQEQEIALEEDVLGLFLKYDTDIDINEMVVDAPDGRRRVHMDESNGEVEIEFSHKHFAEDDAEFWREDVLKDLLENKDCWKDMFNREKSGELDDMKEILKVLVYKEMFDSVKDMGQGDKKDKKKQCGCCESKTDGQQEHVGVSNMDEKRQSVQRREDPDEERWERLNELEEKMNERLEG